MSRRSSIEGHPNRHDIEVALQAGESLRSIAYKFSVTASSLFRFKSSLNREGAETHGQTQPSAPPIRVRTRPPPQADGPLLEPTEARLRDVSWMKAKGATRAEIASRYRVTEGTVSEWLRRARESGLNRVRGLTKEDILATVFEAHEVRMAELKALYETAKGAGDRRAALDALKLWQAGDRHMIDMAHDLGILAREAPTSPDADDELIQEVQAFARIMAMQGRPS